MEEEGGGVKDDADVKSLNVAHWRGGGGVRDLKCVLLRRSVETSVRRLGFEFGWWFMEFDSFPRSEVLENDFDVKIERKQGSRATGANRGNLNRRKKVLSKRRMVKMISRW